MLRDGSACDLGVRGQPGCSTFSTVVGSAVGDSVASQSRSSLPAISGCTPRVVSGGTAQSGEVEQLTNVPEIMSSNEDDVPMAALSRSLASKTEQKEVLFELSQHGRRNPIPASGRDEGGWVFTEEKRQRVPWANLHATGLTNLLEKRHKFYCMMCKVNVSMRSCCIFEITRHLKSVSHICREQRYRERSFHGGSERLCACFIWESIS